MSDEEARREVGRIRPCGSQSAHRPHDGCPGIMPIWPCSETVSFGVHDVHHVRYPDAHNGEGYLCPGSINPPTDMVGPPYAIGAYGWLP